MWSHCIFGVRFILAFLHQGGIRCGPIEESLPLSCSAFLLADPSSVHSFMTILFISVVFLLKDLLPTEKRKIVNICQTIVNLLLLTHTFIPLPLEISLST